MQSDYILFKILLAKLILFGFLMLLHLDIRSRQKLLFFKNFGILRLQLFLISFFIDALLTLLTLEILKLF